MRITNYLNNQTALAGVTMVMFAWSASPSFAEDGDIEQLRRLILQQQAQIETLSNKLEQLAAETKTTNAAADKARQTAQEAVTTADEAARMARKTDEQVAQASRTQTPPKIVMSDKKNVALSISGQVNRALLYVDDGEKQDIFNVDNDNSSTRLRLKGKTRLGENWSAGSTIEVQIESNSSGSVNQFADNGVGAGGFSERVLEIWVDGPYGKLSLGQGKTASDDTSQLDLSGTSVVQHSKLNEMAGGLAFVNSATGLFCTDGSGDGLCTAAAGDVLNTTINSAYTNMDGLSRDDRIRYDTPKFHGFQLSTSAVSGGEADVALRYSAKLGEFKVTAATAYTDQSATSRRVDNQLAGSISVLHDSGANITLAAGEQDGKAGMRDVEFRYAKAGWLFQDLVPMGKTGISFDWGQTDDLAIAGDAFTSFGVGLVHNMSDYGTEFYLGYRNHELERTGVSFEDIDAVMSGARIKF